jgi:hypothetical protein
VHQRLRIAVSRLKPRVVAVWQEFEHQHNDRATWLVQLEEARAEWRRRHRAEK